MGRTLLLAIAVTLWAATSAVAQTCWVYVDSEPAKAPFECRQQGNLSASCSWNGGGSSCHEDGDLSNCCTAVPSSSIAENVLRMHSRWHQCFGNIGRSDGNNPPGRGQRWYAFHRQFEIDFNIWRDQNTTLGPIESLEWLPDMLLPIGHPGVSNNHPDGCGVGVARPANRTCPRCEPFAQCLYMPGGGPTVPGVTPSNIWPKPNT
jgi:hypothetical protein